MDNTSDPAPCRVNRCAARHPSRPLTIRSKATKDFDKAGGLGVRGDLDVWVGGLGGVLLQFGMRR